MKTLSVIQPWASLIAIGAKTIETRSWATNYRGSIAIHASKGFPKGCQELVSTLPYTVAFLDAGIEMEDPCAVGYRTIADKLPRGSVLCVANLIGCEPIDLYFGFGKHRKLFEKEEAFGNFTAGRFAWMLAEVKVLPEPVPAKGSLGLWEWNA